MVALLILALAAQPVPATFYNRPGARPGDVAISLERCRMIVTGTTALGPPLGPPVLNGGEVRAPDDLRRCMRERGWRRFALTRAARRRLAAMPPARRAASIARLEGAVRPAGSRPLDPPPIRLRVPALTDDVATPAGLEPAT
ncbi:hypothetical protein COC42_15095 [Sphingomonas spermidinifaciens]|uniref:Uncharacterized protein n=1 Tax=Sphingomonas spermidinifaciens TaxID=1141889 RepID=A0A2A4B4X4_9SPHN|nr:hypothetical protein [Sphingomonas spermidinifaciens]PCD02706.1 hypothetical protein COC42_15095 [Sphingomonas spermidinifaciens]